MPHGTYTLTEDQLYRLNRARYAIQVMANLLADDSGDNASHRKIGAILDQTSDDMETVVRDVEKTYHA